MPINEDRYKTELALFHFAQTDAHGLHATEMRSRPAIVVQIDNYGVADLFVFFHRTDRAPIGEWAGRIGAMTTPPGPEQVGVPMGDHGGVRRHNTWTRREDR